MTNFYILRLGADSEADIVRIDGYKEGVLAPFEISVKCRQVPKDLEHGDFVVIWLGTNNNKGGKTPWTQGVRALGVIIDVTGDDGYNNEKTVGVSVGIVLNETITKTDLVKKTNLLYQNVTAMPVLGVNNYSSQVVQRIDTSDPDQDILSLFKAIEALHPGFKFNTLDVYPELGSILTENIIKPSVSPQATLTSNTEDSLDEEGADAERLVKPWNPDDIRITTKSFSLRELYTQITENELDLAPEFQRSFVWKESQQVRLVESILLGIPIPVFYFNQDRMGAHQVVDGVQRLTTIRLFMSDILELKQEYLEYLNELKGLKFSTLDPATRRRFAGTQVVAHVIEPQTPDEVKYDIFNRVNTGGSPLSAQEIRHCMSKSRSRKFLQLLVEKPNFDRVMGRLFWGRNESGVVVRDNKRMADREMALRFCAFYTTPIEAYAPSLDRFLLEFTRRLDQLSAHTPNILDLDGIEAAFDRAMENCYFILQQYAFRRCPPGSPQRGPLNRAIFESQAIALADYPLSLLLPHKEAIQNAFRTLFLNPEYDNAVRFGTGDFRKVERRIQMPREVLTRILS